MKKIACILLGVLLFSCSLDKIIKGNGFQPKTEAGETYKAFMNEHVNFIDSGVELLEKYDLIDSNSRNLNSFDITTFILELDDEVFKRKRKVQSGSRSSEESEITLEEEFNDLIEGYEQVAKELTPEYDDALSLEYVKQTDDGYIEVQGGMIIDPTSIDGAVALQVLNAEARGEDTTQISQDLENTIQAMFPDSTIEDEDQSRGHYLYNTFKYPSGKIGYYFDSSVSNAMKVLVRVAAQDWETSTGGVINFTEWSSTGGKIARAMGAPVVSIIEAELDGANGRAILGRSYASWVKFDPSIISNTTNSIRVPRHELGHTIGLHHEHQRWDRDTFLDYNTNSDKYGSDTGKMSKNTKFLQIRIKKIRTPWKTYRIPYIVYATIRKSYTPTTYDYNSIMHYSSNQIDVEVKVAQQGYRVGDAIPASTIISSRDVQTVQSWY